MDSGVKKIASILCSNMEVQLDKNESARPIKDLRLIKSIVRHSTEKAVKRIVESTIEETLG